MEDINKFRIFNRLKTVYRFNSVAARKESSAEHTWSCLMLADFFLSKASCNLDRLKVYELLMYHDVVEIEAGDTPMAPEANESGRREKEEKEAKAAKILEKTLPAPLNSKFASLFNEFEAQKTREAKFAKAIDALDSEIHELDYKKDWKGWTKEFLVKKKAHLFDDFPELKKVFGMLLDYLVENRYFEQD